jgi:Large polyvalent protein-associated domain 7
MANSRESPGSVDKDGREAAQGSNAVGEGEGAKGASRRRRSQRTRQEGERRSTDSARTEATAEANVNAIRPTKKTERRRAGPGAPTAEELPASEKVAPSGSAPPPSKPAEGQADPWTVPQSVRDRFVQDGRRFYFPDGAAAFKDLGRRLTTKSENTVVVGSLIEIAQSRGWEEITVSGTERFRQEAWRQARLAGLTVRGYKASAVEQAQLVRALERRRDGTRAEATPSETVREAAPPSSQVAEPGSRSASAPREASRERIVGKLIDHGRDAYRHDPNEEPSYFVRVETPTGKREIWGRDLERAMTKSLTQPQIGEEITVQRTAREPVTVSRPRKDAQGRVIGEQDVATYRNRWVIERSDFFEARAAAAHVLRDPSIEPKRAVGSHPELAGTYLNLKAAEIASRIIRDPEDQKRFVALVRGALADQIERGEPLQPVRLREREGRSLRRDQERPPVRG